MKKNYLPIRFALMSGLLVCSLIATADGEPFTRMIVFGDSLSDTGNVHDLVGAIPLSPPYFEGRFSNGPVWVEQLAENLDLPTPTPSRLGGTNYAHGSAQTGGGFESFIVPNLGTQISRFLNDSAPQADDLIIVWGGSNDLLDDFATDPIGPVTNLADHISTLAAAGGKSFLVPNLPPLGRTPGFVDTADEDPLNQQSIQFNQLLTTTLDSLSMDLEISIFQLDTFSLFQTLLDDPQSFGFANATEPALVGLDIVGDPQQYIFWDEIHPTTAVHQLLGDVAATQLLVPEPAAILLAAWGVLSLLVYACAGGSKAWKKSAGGQDKGIFSTETNK